MVKEFTQIEWNEDLLDDFRQLIRLAIREDLGRDFDLTTFALVPSSAVGQATINVRERGVACGVKAIPVIFDEMECDCKFEPNVTDGSRVDVGDAIGVVRGNVIELLAAERLILNFLGHLSGISTLTSKFAEQIIDLHTEIYDTRKTTPGYRRLEKYATRCGGARNHRLGLNAAVLIKDNHLAFGEIGHRFSPHDAVIQAKKFIERSRQTIEFSDPVIEVEVDSLHQFNEVLPAHPDIILLDNMSNDDLAKAVNLRNELAQEVVLEASGGVTLETARGIAQTGVDRISVGAITHSARCLDIGLDWTN